MIFWLAIAAIAIAGIYYRHRDTESRNQVLQAMIENGQAVPPDLFDAARSPLDGHRLIVAGIILIALGFASLIFFGALAYFGELGNDLFVPFLSAFPFCLGIGCLIAARVIKRHD